MMKPLVIYHANCADGFGAAFAAWLVLGDKAEYVASQYGTKEDLLNLDIKDRKIYILDFSFPRIAMDYIFTNAKRVVWLDHHRTAFEMWCDEERNYTKHEDKYNTIILDNNKSGAYLAWEYFHPGTEVPMFIRHIDDYDRWKFQIEGTKAFQKALWSYAPWSFEQWKEMFWNEAHDEEFSIEATGLIPEGEAILRAHEQNVQSVVKGAARKCYLGVEGVSVDPYTDKPVVYKVVEGLAANCPPHLQSDVGHELATQSGTYGLLWYINKNGECKCSLRSNGDYDVSAIAKAFGGGGHLNAAGFEVDIQTLLGWIK